jgi:PAS domain S-box-containing protein
MSEPSNLRAGLDFLSGGGEMGERMRAKDWVRTPLGSPQGWPQSLKTCVRLVLTSRQPMSVWWGKELINLYNDACRSMVGGKHPQALGQPASIVWGEIWDQVGPRVATAMSKNEGTCNEALLLIMDCNGYEEEAYYSFSYSPVSDDEGGILCASSEDTLRIVGERQLTLLRELAANTVDARTFEEACALSAQCLQTARHDLPIAMIYRVEPDRLVLAGISGVEQGHPAAPPKVDLDAQPRLAFARAAEGHDALFPAQPELGDLPTGAWPRPPRQFVAVPIPASVRHRTAGVLVAGLNPFRLFNDNYKGFIKLVAAQIAANIASAQAYAEERERGRAEQALREWEDDQKQAEEVKARLAAIVESSDDAIVSKDLNGVIMSWNRGAERLFGYTSQEAIGQSVTMLMPPDRFDEESGILQRIRCGKRIDHYETVRRRKDGTLLDISLSVSPLVDAQGRIVGASKIARDITERKQAELRRSEALSAMGKLVAGLAHEVRNPLFGISSTVDAMNARFKDRKDIQRFTDVLRDEVNRLARLMEELLVYGKPDVLELVPETIEDVLKLAIEAAEPQAQLAQVEIASHVPINVSKVRMNRTRLSQVFQNILLNAIQHAPQGSVVSVEVDEITEDDHRWVQCAVKDSGAGLAQNDLAYIFEPFFTRRRGATGLGLAIAQRVVDDHGGTIIAANRSEGGAIMTVRLPAAMTVPDTTAVRA